MLTTTNFVTFWQVSRPTRANIARLPNALSPPSSTTSLPPRPPSPVRRSLASAAASTRPPPRLCSVLGTWQPHLRSPPEHLGVSRVQLAAAAAAAAGARNGHIPRTDTMNRQSNRLPSLTPFLPSQTYYNCIVSRKNCNSNQPALSSLLFRNKT